MTAEHRRCLCSALKGFPFPETFRGSVSCLSTFEAKSNILPYQTFKGVIHQHLQSPVKLDLSSSIHASVVPAKLDIAKIWQSNHKYPEIQAPLVAEIGEMSTSSVPKLSRLWGNQPKPRVFQHILWLFPLVKLAWPASPGWGSVSLTYHRQIHKTDCGRIVG